MKLYKLYTSRRNYIMARTLARANKRLGRSYIRSTDRVLPSIQWMASIDYLLVRGGLRIRRRDRRTRRAGALVSCDSRKTRSTTSRTRRRRGRRRTSDDVGGRRERASERERCLVRTRRRTRTRDVATISKRTRVASGEWRVATTDEDEGEDDGAIARARSSANEYE